jgi:outer membrane protein assembly factor BamB
VPAARALLAVGLVGCAVRPELLERRGVDAARAVLTFRWEQALAPRRGPSYKPEELSVPLVDGTRGRIYVGSAHGGLYAVRLQDGEFVYHVLTVGPVQSTPLLVPHLGRVFFGSDDGALYAVDAADGHVAWRYETRGAVRSAPSYQAGVLFFTSAEDRVYAVEARSGRWRWHYEREAREGFTIRGQSGAVVAGSRVFAGFSDGQVVALDARTGDLLWSREVGRDGTYVDADGTPVLARDGRTLYVSAYAGGVYALDVATGDVRWRYPVEGATRVAIDDERIYFAAPGDGVHALDHEGRLVWRQAVRQGALSVPVPAGPYVVVTASEAGVYVAAREDGRLLGFFKAGGGVSAEPAVFGAGLYFVSNTGYLYSASLK